MNSGNMIFFGRGGGETEEREGSSYLWIQVWKTEGGRLGEYL